ncbi:DSBA-like thioredoxin domain-containing protein [Brevibacterium iodinum ATCC 49514]|uniref:DSBA-like thioredoxin domain-containing protein n=1 Tax=Brevibacterium iodinum ATCC 49514 TaxID=1255616 RepID=A0A2H1KJV8_9MICO|nr:DsbA family protein [Brevibacterium iodinum]SMX99828.1 DSBA-like thioredoxin domain-containing protein [Brevibacterium iodinum ATCC 49514]SUW11388.1 DSBA-like thioredoxin domain [Brevibacterium iodinum]
MPTPVEVYVDYVCPFCFLADNALNELKRHRDVEIQTKSFELRPDPVPTLCPEDDYLPRIWSDSVYPMAARLGIDIRLPTISPQPRTELAFIGLQIAEEHDLAPEYNTSVQRVLST